MPPTSRTAFHGRHVFVSRSSEDAAIAEGIRSSLGFQVLTTWFSPRVLTKDQIWGGLGEDRESASQIWSR
jgi:hypothetical protein